MVDPRSSLSAVQGMPVQSAPDPPFVVDPGFQPIPAKTVAAIVMGEYIKLGNLLLRSAQSPSTLLIRVDDRVVVSASPKPAPLLTDILLWCQAFATFSLIMSSYRRARVLDLHRYFLLILHTHAQFEGLAWFR